MAPDAGSVSAGRKLADGRKWSGLGRNEVVAWGEIAGSGAKPYLTAIDLADPAFKCSCPSRKFPCKHGLALALLLADGQLTAGDPPTWVEEWIASRQERKERQAAKAATPATPPDAATAARQAAERGKRATTRNNRVVAGLEELRRWLEDLLRQGLSSPALTAGYGHFDRMAARLVDQQAPTLARRVRALGARLGSGTGDAAALTEIAQLALTLEGFSRREQLPEAVQAELESQIGFTHSSAEVLAGPPLRDCWQVLGSADDEEDRLQLRRTWLWGEDSRQTLLLLDFAVGQQPLPPRLAAGSRFDADLCLYPGLPPQRALIGTRHGVLEEAQLPACGDSVLAHHHAHAMALAANPWLSRYPVLLGAVFPVQEGGEWYLTDATGRWPLASEPSPWELYARSGGEPLALFGEWDGDSFRPLTLFPRQGGPGQPLLGEIP